MEIKYEQLYKEEAEMFANIVGRFQRLQENDIQEAYKLMVDSLQAYNRWSKIKLDIKKDLGRGEKAALKDRLEEICRYLKEVHVSSRMVWKYARDDKRNNEEF
mgnify:CR=1 FL=1